MTFFFHITSLEGKMKEIFFSLQQIPAKYIHAGAALFFGIVIVIAISGWLDYWKRKVLSLLFRNR
jgi:hypothetical protein